MDMMMIEHISLNLEGTDIAGGNFKSKSLSRMKTSCFMVY